MRLEAGTQIGPFEILEPLGAGGMGEVYRARDPRLQRDVAVKILSGDLAGNADAMARFEREARAVAALSHPNILAIHDIGTHQGASYAVTEVLEGETLRSRLDRSPLTWTRAAAISAEVAAGVAAAHAKSIIHRDLKPANIFLTADGRVKILDFGLAAVRSAPTEGLSADAITVTHAGTILGTVGYMSPEQVGGDSTGPPSDIFSLGCVMYEMVTGQQPFNRKTALQTLNAILESDPTPLAQCGRPTPPEFDRLISRCLEKDPALRMQSARDLSVALGELPTGTFAENAPAGKRYRQWAPAGALLLVALVVIMAFGPIREQFFRSARSRSINSLAVLPLDNLSGDATQDYFADGVTEALITNLGRSGDLRVIARAAVMEYKNERPSLGEVASQLDVQAIVTGSVLRSNEHVQVAVQLIDPATDGVIWSENFDSNLTNILMLQTDVARAITSQLSEPSPTEQQRLDAKRTVDPEAYESYLRALYLLSSATTDEISQKTIDLLEHAVNQDANLAPAYAALARAYINRRTDIAPQEAGTLEPKAFAAAERALLLDSQLAEAYVARGDLLWTPSHRFAHERAVQEYRRALKQNPNLDGAHEGLARIYAHVGFLEEALSHASKALDSNPSNGLALHHQSETLLWMDNNDAALAVLKSIPQPVFPELVAAHTAWAQSRLGKHEDALNTLHQASIDFPDDPSGVLAAVNAMFLAESKPGEAELRIERASRSGGYNPSHHTAYFVGCAYAKMGRAEEAVRQLKVAADTGFPCYPLLARDPNLDPIRQDPKFQSFLNELEKQSTTLRKRLFAVGP